MTAEELIESLCSSGNLGQMDPNLQLILCGDDKKLAEEVANRLMEYANTLQDVRITF